MIIFFESATVSGDPYSGIIIPMVVQEISNDTFLTNSFYIFNFKALGVN